MSAAASLSGTALLAVQDAFLAELPRITKVIRYHTRRRPARERHEARQEMLAAAWHAWIGLARRGRDPRAVGPTGLAANAVRYVANGRRLGTGVGGPGLDVFDPQAQHRLGYRLVGLDREGDRRVRGGAEGWQQWLAADHRVSPADEAAFRLDFAAWLELLPARKRRIAERLAAGCSTGELARELGVTPAAVSQARTWLARDWARYQGEENRAPATVDRIPEPAGAMRAG